MGRTYQSTLSPALSQRRVGSQAQVQGVAGPQAKAAALHKALSGPLIIPPELARPALPFYSIPLGLFIVSLSPLVLEVREPACMMLRSHPCSVAKPVRGALS